MKKIFLVFLISMLPALCSAETIKFTKSDAINLTVSSYVHGFKEFGTSVIGLDDSVSIGIYYDSKTQQKQTADILAKRFRKQVPAILSRYSWGKKVKVHVSVYTYDRMESGY